MYIDKMPWKSKKFIAFFSVELILAALLIVLFVTQVMSWPVAFLGSVLALGMCSLAIGYILGQAALDRFIDGVGQLGTKISSQSTEEVEETEEYEE